MLPVVAVLALAVLLALGRGDAQTGSPAAVPRPLADAAASELLDEYLTGDYEAAVDELSRRRPLRMSSPWPELPVSASWMRSTEPQVRALAAALLQTEAGFRNSTFGRIAKSAPLVPARPTVGLSGMFELPSLITSRLML